MIHKELKVQKGVKKKIKAICADSLVVTTPQLGLSESFSRNGNYNSLSTLKMC